MAKNSTLVLNEVTCLDHATISPGGYLLGGSINPTIYVTGKVTKDESVVCDFGTIKRLIKEAIDHRDYGFDHKLIVNVTNPSVNITVKDDGYIDISTPQIKLCLPRNAIKFVSTDSLNVELTDFLNEKFPDYQFSVHVNERIVVPESSGLTVPAKFRYCHPLRYSSSWGCRNGGHGHLSYIVAKCLDDETAQQLKPYVARLASILNAKYFVDKEIAHYSSNGSRVIIEYEAEERGYFELNLPADTVEVLDTETTVEYLGEYILDVFLKKILPNEYHHKVLALIVSEGLWKGTYVPNPLLEQDSPIM